jgi:hypothetical protein
VTPGKLSIQTSREDLAVLTFGSRAGRNDELFARLRNMSLSKDADAPVHLSGQELQQFETRKDLRGLRSAMDAARRAGESKTARTLGDRICYLVEALSSLKLKEKRGEYFKHVETLRAQRPRRSVI